MLRILNVFSFIGRARKFTRKIGKYTKNFGIMAVLFLRRKVYVSHGLIQVIIIHTKKLACILDKLDMVVYTICQ